MSLKKLIISAVIALLVIITFFSSYNIVKEGYVGVKYRFGYMVESGIEPGMRFHAPFIESIKKVDVREHVAKSELTAYTKDTQSVESIITKINYYIDKNQVGTIVKSIGIDNVQSKLINPKSVAVIKDMVGKYKAEDLIAYRSELQTRIKETLTDELAPYGIIITSVNVQDILFVDSFEAVVEAKVAAEQQALKVKNETIQKEEEAKQKVIAAEAEAKSILTKAKAEAQANKLLNESLTSNLIKYEQIQKWNGEYPQVMGNTVNPFVAMDKTESK